MIVPRALVLLCALSIMHAAEQPNVIFILTDDMGYGDLGALGNPRVKTPNIDRLHAQSVRFTNHHVAPVCAPTRGELMTGIGAYRNGASTALYSHTMVRREIPLMPQFFKDNSYVTAHFGKWHLGDNYPFHPQDRGFDLSYHYNSFGLNSIAGHWENCAFDDIGWRNYASVRFNGYTTDFLFGETMRWMREQTRPFFIYLAPIASKKPLYVPAHYVKPYDDLDKTLAEFYGMIANLDENVGHLLKFLEASGLSRNTIVVYMHDNGPDGHTGYNTAGMRGISGSLYEGGHRAPLFIRWPAGLQGPPRDIDALTHSTDLLPTLIDLCGLKVTKPASFDGHSLKPLLEGASDPDPDRKVVIQYGAEFKEWDCAVLWKKWRLVNGTELYDIDADPGQKTDIASSKPEIVQELRRHYEKWVASTRPLLNPEKYVIVGSPLEPVTRLTSDEWSGSRGSHWKYIAVTSEPVVGHWKIEAAATGDYDILLYMFPPEANTPLNQALRNVPARPVAGARVLLDGKEVARQTASTATHARFKLPLKQGERHRLEGQFFDGAGQTLCGSFFTVVHPSDKPAK
jgi:arylsulfatase